MASDYPGAIDTFPPIANPTVTHTNVAPTLSDRLHDIYDAITAIQTELGIDPAGGFNTVAEQLEDILDDIEVLQITLSALQNIVHEGTVHDYASTLTPNPAIGFHKMVLTGNLTVNAPSGTPGIGDRLTIMVVQDATGNRTVTFNSAFKTTTSVGTTANRATLWEFRYDGNAWFQVACTNNIPV